MATRQVIVGMVLLVALCIVSHLPASALAQQDQTYDYPDANPASDETAGSDFPGAENQDSTQGAAENADPAEGAFENSADTTEPAEGAAENTAQQGDSEAAGGGFPADQKPQEKMADAAPGEGQTNMAPGDTQGDIPQGDTSAQDAQSESQPQPEGDVPPADQDNSAGAAMAPGAMGADGRYNFTKYTNSWKKIEGGEVGPEAIIGAAIGAVLGMSLCICGICICYIRQRNIARAQYGPTGGAIEL